MNGNPKLLPRDLQARFRLLYEKPPHWAWPFAPSIPFVGARYRREKSILVYASAENFTWLRSVTVPDRFTNARAFDRYRAVYEEEQNGGANFFPDVGIQPATDGGLLAAARFAALQRKLPHPQRPRDFLETMALTNWCKFSIRTNRKNRDYVHDLPKLAASLPFVVAELAALAPRLVLLPKAVWNKPLLRAAMRGAAPGAAFVPLPQFNATVVNCHLQAYDRAARKLSRTNRDQALIDWMGRLERMHSENAWRFLACLDDALNRTLPPPPIH